MSDTVRTALAVILGGVVGTIVNSVAVSFVIPSVDLLQLLQVPGRYTVAILVTALLPLIYAQTSGSGAMLVSIAALTIIPSVLAKMVFGVGAPWHLVLLLNLVFAVVAWAVYNWVMGRSLTT